MDKNSERAKPDDTNSFLHPPLRMAVKLQLVRGGTTVFALEMEFPGGL